jgi:hypothetical protein
VLRPIERPYRGFAPYTIGDSSEIVLSTQEQFDLFNRYIVGLAG